MHSDSEGTVRAMNLLPLWEVIIRINGIFVQVKHKKEKLKILYWTTRESDQKCIEIAKKKTNDVKKKKKTYAVSAISANCGVFLEQFSYWFYLYNCSVHVHFCTIFSLVLVLF